MITTTPSFNAARNGLSIPEVARPPGAASGSTPTATSVTVDHLTAHVGDERLLGPVSFRIEPGEIVAIAGGSGAGKTTLLEALAGLRPSSGGSITTEGEQTRPGFVPQDDIIHGELSLRRTLEHAARIRLGGRPDRAAIRAVVDDVLTRLELAERADVRVARLSGGQRKRASIAVELLAGPRLFFLDEPTSGLDPATAAEFMRQLRRLADDGTTIVLTTHSTADLDLCDRVLFLAAGGHLAFDGSPTEATRHYGVRHLGQVYEAIAASPPPAEAGPPAGRQAPRVKGVARRGATAAGAWRQWLALTRRTFDLQVGNKLTLAILAGSPAMVVGMMALLFRADTFDRVDASAAILSIQTVYWVAFASFFFGVTYGLLQVVGEFAIFRRERFAGLSVTAYVGSKVAILGPLLLAVNVLMLGVLQLLDRLPATGPAAFVELLIGSTLTSAAALSVGLLASAAVHNPAQATLALPMLCFPQVLFAGAVVPTSEMASAGRFFSNILANRWGFEALGRTFGIDAGADTATIGYLDAFTGGPVQGWLVLLAMTAVALVATGLTLDRRSR